MRSCHSSNHRTASKKPILERPLSQQLYIASEDERNGPSKISLLSFSGQESCKLWPATFELNDDSVAFFQ